MTINEFDTLAADQRTLELPESTQRRHLAMLADLLTDNGNDAGADRDTDRVPAAETITAVPTRPVEPGKAHSADSTTTAAAPKTDNVLRPKFSKGKRTALIAGSVVLLAGAGIGTAAAFGAFAEPTDRALSHCYTDADLNAAHNNFSLATTSGESGDAAGYALEICGRDWANGRLQQGASQVYEPDESGRTYPVPPLSVCVLASGQVGVFPGGEGTCRQLGLPIADL